MALRIDRTPTPTQGLYNEETTPDEVMAVERSYTPIPVFTLAKQAFPGHILWEISCIFTNRSGTPPLLGCEPPPFSNLQAADLVLAPASPLPDPVSPPTSSAESDSPGIEPLSSVFTEFDSWLEHNPPNSSSTSSSCPPCEPANTHSSNSSAQKRPRSPENSPKLSAKRICQGLDDGKKEAQATTAKTKALAAVCHSVPQPMQSGPVFLIYTPSPDAPFPQSKTFPLVPRTETQKKTLSQTKTGIKHTLLSHLENACTELGTNDGQVSREALIINVYQRCLAGFTRFKKTPMDKTYLNNFQVYFADFVSLIREGKDDLITLISFKLKKVCKLENRDSKRFEAIRNRFRQLSPISPAEDTPDVAILKLLDELYVREPNWQQFVSGTFALLKGQIKTEKAFKEIAFLIEHSWRYSFFKQTPLELQDIPDHSLFDELFTFKKFKEFLP